ncbi:NADH-quinone oxidoreductase subunit A 2 [Geotalea uraniireducens]|uniref:NADH-quinone oxidoreductase subunit A n=1 Tax=Geotalea uraniireducens TaxID=351604 RepID=A0ABM8EQV2_9BACT|nr:NADH-quinone oxidoreductase subunit A [Geotalea uraniireducens]BDV44890.1 NADH-quinone oxidoreductase subunit A 2 [Geotalea uraniireducens]
MPHATPAQTFSLSALPPEFLPLALYTAAATLLIGILLLVAWWLGGGSTSRNKEIPYESGVIPTGSARLAYPVPFYLIAIFFIVFDVEAAFIFAWAVARRPLGLAGLLHITFFIVILLLGLVWLWLKGGLDWGPSRERRGRGGE